MKITELLQKKRDNLALTKEEIEFFIAGVVNGEVRDYQSSAMLMAMFINGLNDDETTNLTMAMANNGANFDLSQIDGIKVDKHSTGGVGDKTTIIITPIVASLGVKVAKMSGRGLGHTGGTIDKLESIEGFRVSLSKEEFISQVNRLNGAIISQSGDICPADKKLYELRDVTATVESLPLIVASVMSKKIASGADKILLDIKMGSGAFMKTRADAERLARKMEEIGGLCGRETICILSEMDQPLGKNVGNTLEILECVDVLKGVGDSALTEKCVELSAIMLFLGGLGTVEECKEMAVCQITNGKAYQKLLEIARAQGGKVIDDELVLKNEKVFEGEITAEKDGEIAKIDALLVGQGCVILGAGREKIDDTINYSAGAIIHKRVGDVVKKGEKIATLFGSSPASLDEGIKVIQKGIVIT